MIAKGFLTEWYRVLSVLSAARGQVGSGGGDGVTRSKKGDHTITMQQHIWSSWVNAPYHCDAGDEGDLGAHGETEVSGVGSENEHLCNVV